MARALEEGGREVALVAPGSRARGPDTELLLLEVSRRRAAVCPSPSLSVPAQGRR